MCVCVCVQGLFQHIASGGPIGSVGNEGRAAQTTQWYIIQPTIAFVSVCMAKV